MAITGFGRNADIDRALSAGFYSHLTKPLNLQALAEILEGMAQLKEKDDLDRRKLSLDHDVSAGPVC